MTKRLEMREVVIDGHLFILGANKIGERLTEHAQYEWVDKLDLSTGVETSRGGNSSELNALEVGLLTTAFPGLDPTTLNPGQGIRVVNERPPAPAALEASIENIGTAPFTGTWTTAAEVADGIRLTAAASVQLATAIPADSAPGTTATLAIAAAAAATGVQFTAPALPAGWAGSHAGTVPVVAPLLHRWSGTPHASTSEKLVNGALTAVNLLTNPSFEADVTDWTTPNLTAGNRQLVADAVSGGVALRLFGGTLSASRLERLAVLSVAGTYTMSIYHRVNDLGGVAPSSTWGQVTDATTGTVLVQGPAAWTYLDSQPLGEWVRSSVTFTIAAPMTARVRWYIGGRDIDFDAAMLHAGSAPLSYFDGDSPSILFTYTATGPVPAVIPAGVFTRPSSPVDVTIGQWSVDYTKTLPPDVEWHGKVNDVISVDRRDGSSLVSVPASDAMTQITGTLIAGIGSDAQTFRQRAEDLAAAGQGIDFTIDDAGTGGSRVEPAWTPWGALPANVVIDTLAPRTEQYANGALAGTLYRTRSTKTVTQTATTSGIEANLTGLTPTSVYKVTARLRSTFKTTSGDWADLYRFGVAGIGWTDQFRIGKYADDTVTVSYTFTATATTHALRLTLAEQLTTSGAEVMESVVIGDLYVIDQSADPYRLGDNLLEGSLADHLNLLCDSVGGIWRPTVDAGIVLNRFITPAIKAGFSDEADAPLGYTTLAMSYSTQNIVNVLRIRNIGASGGTAGEATHLFEDHNSILKWGRRSKEITTNLQTAPMVRARGAELLAERAQPSYQPTALTYRSDDLAVSPDIHDAIVVHRRGVDYTALVVGIDQKINPHDRDTDLTTLTLRSL